MNKKTASEYITINANVTKARGYFYQIAPFESIRSTQSGKASDEMDGGDVALVIALNKGQTNVRLSLVQRGDIMDESSAIYTIVEPGNNLKDSWEITKTHVNKFAIYYIATRQNSIDAKWRFSLRPLVLPSIHGGISARAAQHPHQGCKYEMILSTHNSLTNLTWSVK